MERVRTVMEIKEEYKNRLLTKKWLCEILNLPEPYKDEVYTKIFFAHEVQPNGVAILSVNTSDPKTVTSHERAIELADQAIERGAKLLISTFQVKDYECLIVDDVLGAYCHIVETIRLQYTPKTIGITGSIGKTTTTQMVYSVISNKYNSHRNDSSANNLRLAAGVIQNLKPEHEFYIQEIMEGPPYCGASPISKIVHPNVAIVTLVGSSHLETFGTQERILESCLSIQDGMDKEGLLILNGDDPYQWNAKCSHKKIYYAIDNDKADYRAINVRNDGKKIFFDIKYADGIASVCIRCFGRHNVLNALASFVAGKWAGMSDEEIAEGLYKYRTSGIRQNLVNIAGIDLYLDCYNAALESIKTSLETLGQIPIRNGGCRIAVLADIKESGDQEKFFHIQVGNMVTKSKVERLICYGKASRFIASTVLSDSDIPVFCTESAEELEDYLAKKIKKDDLVLYKGSHSMSLEKIVDSVYGTWFSEEYDRYEFRTHIYKDDDLLYRIYPNHVVVIEKRNYQENIIVPDEVDGVPVTSIGVSVFNKSKSLRSIILPSGLTNIRYRAFLGSKIQVIVIPEGTKIIGESAFSGCENLEEAEIGMGCIHISFQAFANCKKLRKIYIPLSVQEIENEVFLHCDNVTIYGERGSYVESYAKKLGIAFVTK